MSLSLWTMLLVFSAIGVILGIIGALLIFHGLTGRGYIFTVVGALLCMPLIILVFKTGALIGFSWRVVIIEFVIGLMFAFIINQIVVWLRA